MTQKYSGGCKCGNISYTVNGEVQWKVSCHCNWCQTSSGAAFRTFVLFNENDLEISGDTLKSYEDNDTEHGSANDKSILFRMWNTAWNKGPQYGCSAYCVGNIRSEKRDRNKRQYLVAGVT